MGDERNSDVEIYQNAKRVYQKKLVKSLIREKR